ncbi:MAG: hypothetical protein NTX49_06140 [Chlamydiae bacterium]|nr:hypothetical protein [Chlamydiota bacterium]
MAAIASSPFSGIAASCEERTFVSVISVSKDNIETVQKTIKSWQDTANLIRNELELRLKNDPHSEGMLHDLKLISDCQIILHGSACQVSQVLANSENLKILLAIDSLGEIQAIACCGMNFEEELLVGELVTSPSNIRWNTKLTSLSDPIYGGGTLLMHAIFKIAAQIKKPKIGLDSSTTAEPFYKKLGMKQDLTSFEFILSEKSHHQNIERALARAFGPSFRYSLLS